MAVRAEQVKLALQNKHVDDFFLTEVKNGPTQSVRNHFKMDALAMKKSWVNQAIIGYEIKVARSDFQRDDKWPAYLPMCNQFSFVCPSGLIQPDELPPEVGLIWYNPEKNSLTTKRKALHRLIDEPVNMYKYIIMSKLDSDRHPFYSSAREYFEAWVADKRDSRVLGAYVSEKLRKELNDLRVASERAERTAERYEPEAKLFHEIDKIMREGGISVNTWNTNWQDHLRQALSGGLNPKALWVLRKLTDNASDLQRMLEPVEQTQIREEQL